MNLRAFLFVALGIAVAAVLFVLLRPPADIAPAKSSFDFIVRNGERVSGPETMQARQGDDVEIKVTADAPDELHLHGYDAHAELRANEAAVLKFKATHSGRFDLELHHADVTLATLEIQPE